MAYKDIRLTLTGGVYDWQLVDGKFSWAEDGTAIAQSVFVRVRKFFAESRFSPSQGLKWYEKIFPPHVSRAEKELEVKRVILGTSGVESISYFTMEQPTASHTLTIDCGIITEFGAETVSGSITPL